MANEGTKVTIIRAIGSEDKARQNPYEDIPADVLADAVAKPTVRAESVLDGIFAQGVIVIEADSDRLVYQTAWETMADEFHQDIHFAFVEIRAFDVDLVADVIALDE